MKAVKLNRAEEIQFVNQVDTAGLANHKLEVLKDLYRSFIDTTFELVLRTSLDGKILFANKLFLSNFEIPTYRRLKQLNFADFLEVPDSFMAIRSRLQTQRRIVSEVIYFRKNDGSRLTGRINVSIHHNTKGLPVMNWAILNISQQVESEEDLKSKNDELAKVNHQMEKFLYSTSHDLRSPLTTILGLVNLLRMETKEAVILDYISKVEGSTLRLDKIIRDIMSFSRTTYQRMTSEKIEFESLVWKALENYRTDPGLRKINFEVTSEGSFPFFNDAARLEIVIDNVVRNCANFFDENKARPFVKVNIIVERERATLEFIDNGIGIGSQHLAYVFNMFYKATHHSKGAGLGLFIVKETLEKLGGTVSIESEIGFGTVVRICIPNDHKGVLISRKLELQNNA